MSLRDLEAVPLEDEGVEGTGVALLGCPADDALHLVVGRQAVTRMRSERGSHCCRVVRQCPRRGREREVRTCAASDSTSAGTAPGSPSWRRRRTRQSGRIPATPEGLAALAATLRPDDRVVLEATTKAWAIVELLEAHDGEVIVSDPLRTRAIADARTKTDTIDAATLAQLLAVDYLPVVWQPDAETRALRRRVAARAALVAERARPRNRNSASSPEDR